VSSITMVDAGLSALSSLSPVTVQKFLVSNWNNVSTIGTTTYARANFRGDNAKFTIKNDGAL
jgi:hypothetical protein